MVEILVPGAQSSVQDLGRPGPAALGVPESGAADRLSLVIGNRLLGNADDAAALELTLTGPSFRVHGDCAAMLVGCCGGWEIDGRPLPCWTPVRLKGGAGVSVGRTTWGCRGYICFAGGIVTPEVMASRSTHAALGLGRPGARLGEPGTLRAGDALPLNPLPLSPGPPTVLAAERACLARRSWRGGLNDLAHGLRRRRLRVTPAPSAAPAWVAAVLAPERCVLPASDRMGLRLEALPVATGTSEAETVPAGRGYIQSTPDGGLIVLGPDAAPTGGYPLVGAVVAADLHALGQVRPGDRLSFEIVDLRRARALRSRLHEDLGRVLPAASDAVDAERLESWC